MMLAQSQLDGDFTLKALVFILLMLQIANIIMGIVRGQQAKRRSVSFEGVPVEKTEFDKHVHTNAGEHRDIFAKLGGQERGLRGETEQKVQALSNEVKQLNREMAANTTETKHLGDQVKHFDAKLDRVIEGRRG